MLASPVLKGLGIPCSRRVTGQFCRNDPTKRHNRLEEVAEGSLDISAAIGTNIFKALFMNQFDLEAPWTVIVPSTQLLDTPAMRNLRERFREVDLVDKIVFAVTGRLRLVRRLLRSGSGCGGDGFRLLATFLAAIAAPLATLTLTMRIVLWVTGLEIGALFLIFLHAFPLNALPVARAPLCVMAIRGNIAVPVLAISRCVQR